jgi:hypothetical protein
LLGVGLVPFNQGESESDNQYDTYIPLVVGEVKHIVDDIQYVNQCKPYDAHQGIGTIAVDVGIEAHKEYRQDGMGGKLRHYPIVKKIDIPKAQDPRNKVDEQEHKGHIFDAYF